MQRTVERGLPWSPLPCLARQGAQAVPLAAPQAATQAVQRAPALAVRQTLVERFDIEPFSDFSAK